MLLEAEEVLKPDRGATLPTAAMVECVLRGVVVAWSNGRGAGCDTAAD